ncbi:MAG: hypothetical protein Q7J35_00040 [Candidatus Methanoperedens sp.]|nr:hypothetical protein [Candidatus Methanoperedens sp.]
MLTYNRAGVSPPGDSLIYGCEASQRQGLTGSLSSDLRTAAWDRARRHSSAITAGSQPGALTAEVFVLSHIRLPARSVHHCPSGALQRISAETWSTSLMVWAVLRCRSSSDSPVSSLVCRCAPWGLRLRFAQGRKASPHSMRFICHPHEPLNRTNNSSGPSSHLPQRSGLSGHIGKK